MKVKRRCCTLQLVRGLDRCFAAGVVIYQLVLWWTLRERPRSWQPSGDLAPRSPRPHPRRGTQAPGGSRTRFLLCLAVSVPGCQAAMDPKEARAPRPEHRTHWLRSRLASAALSHNRENLATARPSAEGACALSSLHPTESLGRSTAEQATAHGFVSGAAASALPKKHRRTGSFSDSTGTEPRPVCTNASSDTWLIACYIVLAKAPAARAGVCNCGRGRMPPPRSRGGVRGVRGGGHTSSLAKSLASSSSASAQISR
jgi:hypothetical protein